MRYEPRHATWIEIAAPDGPSAFLLERRLSHLAPVTVEVNGAWTVELEDSDDSLEEIEAVVRHWLRDERIPETSVRLNGNLRTVEAELRSIFRR
jgi:hypothetical protein